MKMNYNRQLVLIFFIFGICHTEDKLFKRVINGEDAPPNTYPWAVFIKANNPFKLFAMGQCGGTLISDQWLVTAAHCVYAENRNGKLVPNLNAKLYHLQAGHTNVNLKFRGGENIVRNIVEKFLEICLEIFDITPNIKYLPVSKIVVHPNYNPSISETEWDIALIKLRSPVYYWNFPGINPVDLPPSDVGSSWPTNGQECVLIGWGCQKAHGSAVSKAQLARLDIMSHDRCISVYNNQRNIVNLDHEFCAGFYQKGHGICSGDSGSGLVCKMSERWVLAGVTSSGHKWNPKDYPGIFTRVSYFRKWIDEQMIEE